MDLSRRRFLLGGTALVALAVVRIGSEASALPSLRGVEFEVTLPEEEWQDRLEPDAYAVLREEATERPFSSPLNTEARTGTFSCGDCNLAVFPSSTKFDAGTGWLSFSAPIAGSVLETSDPTPASGWYVWPCTATGLGDIWGTRSRTARSPLSRDAASTGSR